LIYFSLKRLLRGFFVLLGVITLLFWLFQGLGDPDRIMMGQSGDSSTLAAIKKDLHLDQPVWKQFLLYVNDVSPLSFYQRKEMEVAGISGFFWGGERGLCLKLPYLGKSYHSKKEVAVLIAEALPGTILLAVTAILFATIVGILLGVLAAAKRGTIWDTASMMASVIGVSMPSFFMAMLIAWIFGYLLSAYTGLNMTGSWREVDFVTGHSHVNLKALILPAITLGIRPLAIVAQLTRSLMLEEMQKDYIQTAVAKGLTNSSIYFRHALRNALNPVITAISGWFAELLGGAFFVEYIFGWKGIGKLTVDAVEQLDYPLVMGSVMVAASFFIVVGIITDVLYVRMDPRVRLS
jgi:peptide/nickel transport system permease protein